MERSEVGRAAECHARTPTIDMRGRISRTKCPILRSIHKAYGLELHTTEYYTFAYKGAIRQSAPRVVLCLTNS